MENRRAKRARHIPPEYSETPEAPAVGSREQVLLKRLQIEGFKTFRESEVIDVCPGWQPTPYNEEGSLAPSPLTVVFGGNGAGKSALFDGVFFVLSGQSSKCIRSSRGSAQLVNDQSVVQKGPDAFASVTITFQKAGACQGMDIDSEQGKACSRAAMMQALNAFVGADMGDVDRYLLKQGSTMVCRRDGKELLSFIERLAGTTQLKTQAEQVQNDLDDLREEALSLEVDVQSSVHARKGLQPQVEAFVAHQKQAAELQKEKTGLWQRKLALLRVRLEEVESIMAKNKCEADQLRGQMKSSKAKHESAERRLARATQAAEKALKSQSGARGKVQRAKSDQAELEALASETLKSARTMGKALTRALKQLEEGNMEISGLSAQSSELHLAVSGIQARIDELERSPELNVPGGEGFDEREELVRELSSLEEDLLPELEKCIAERKRTISHAGTLLDNLVSDASAARVEMETRDGVAASSRKELQDLQRRIVEMDTESAKLRAHCTSQQALIGHLETRRASRDSADTDKRSPPAKSSSSSTKRQGGAAGRQSAPDAHGRVGALRSLVEKLRKGGVGAHGMLADLLLLRRPCDEAAVAAVLGSALRNTVVVQTRKDGARVVAAVRAAGINGQVRCDVLDEMRFGNASASAGRGRGGGQGLSPLSECVTTSDPRHFSVVEKYLRRWLLAETRQVAWGARSAPSKSSAANIVTSSGELFYASGEVAVKAPHTSTSSYTPRLGVLRGGKNQPQPQQQPQGVGSQGPIQQQAGTEESAHEVEVPLKRALESLSGAEARAAELARETAQARFDCEDAQARHATTQNSAKECLRKVLVADQKVSAQRRLLVSGSNSCGAEDPEEVQLEELRQRRKSILGELAEAKEGYSCSQRGVERINVDTRAAVTLELRNLRAKADAESGRREEVGVKLRVLTKRGKARRDRVKTITEEKKSLEAQHQSSKAEKLILDEKIANLISALEVTKSAYQDKREAAREAEGSARKAKRELSSFEATRMDLSMRQEALTEDRHKAQVDASHLVRYLAEATRTAAYADGPSSRDGLEDEAAEAEEDVHDSATVTAEEGTRLSRDLETFIFFQKSNSPRPTDGKGDDDEGRRGAPPSRKGGRRERSKSPEMRITADREEDEASVAAFVGVLKAANGGGGGGKSRGRGYKDFVGDTDILEASIRLKEADLQKHREAIDIAAVTQAVSLDREYVILERKVEAARESVVFLMDKKEVLEETRHGTLIKCLEEVNEALGGIYRRLTSAEAADPENADNSSVVHSKRLGTFGMRGAPGGDCFLCFSRERSLLVSEGLSVQVKPETTSPWRGPGSLSGGQVALVGLALNLATQAVRPAPLYLMDEVR
ncbi:unnamed protein product, partial [Ectocarpus sp. 12 AP-2014]